MIRSPFRTFAAKSGVRWCSATSISEARYLSLWLSVNHRIQDHLAEREYPFVDEVEADCDVIKVVCLNSKTLVINKNLASKQVW